MRRQLFALAASVGMVLAMAATGYAASPSSGSIGPSATSTTWTGKTFTAAATPGPSACPPSSDGSDTLCDHYKLNVSVGSTYWSTHTGGASVSIAWQGSSNDFDLYVFNASGKQVGASTASQGTSEHVFISKASGNYEVRVVPKSVINANYSGSAVFSSKANSTGSGGGSSGGGSSGGGTSGGGTSGGTSGGKTGGKTGGGSSGGGTSGGGSGGTVGGSCVQAGCSFAGNPVSQEKAYFTYGVDRKDWYWQKQFYKVISGTGQPIQLPDPQAADTLPVSVDQAKPDKISAIYFGLLARGVQTGSSIVQFKMRIQEGDTPSTNPTSNQDQAEFNVQSHQIEACRATQFWPDGGGAEVWNTKPTFRGCVTGKRSGKPGSTFWTFDLTQLAQPWGANPNANFGVVLYPVIPKNPGPQDQEWQINLKIPARDNPQTPSNEYNDTKNRAVATIAFTTPAAASTGGVSSSGVFGSTSAAGGSSGTFTGPGSGTGGFPSTTTTTTTTTKGFPSSSGGSNSSGNTRVITPTAGVPPVKLPAVVWALLPIGLIAIWAIRQIVLEPVGGVRQEGVIATIRRRNAAARGMPVEESENALAQARLATRRARTFIRKSLRKR